MATNLIEQNKYLYANASSIRNTAVETAKLSVLYPYPPKSCKDAINISKLLDNELTKGLQSNSETYKQAVISLKAQFDNYIVKAKCQEKEISAEDAAYKKELQDALDKEAAASKRKTMISNGIIIAIVGVLVLGAGIIILKKRKA